MAKPFISVFVPMYIWPSHEYVSALVYVMAKPCQYFCVYALRIFKPQNLSVGCSMCEIPAGQFTNDNILFIKTMLENFFHDIANHYMF